MLRDFVITKMKAWAAAIPSGCRVCYVYNTYCRVESVSRMLALPYLEETAFVYMSTRSRVIARTTLYSLQSFFSRAVHQRGKNVEIFQFSNYQNYTRIPLGNYWDFKSRFPNHGSGVSQTNERFIIGSSKKSRDIPPLYTLLRRASAHVCSQARRRG